jgi:hypothetical protein
LKVKVKQVFLIVDFENLFVKKIDPNLKLLIFLFKRLCFGKDLFIVLPDCSDLFLQFSEIGVSKVFLLGDVGGFSFCFLDFVIESCDLFGMESGGQEEVVFLFGEEISFFPGSVVELVDALFFELVFFFDFLVLLSE